MWKMTALLLLMACSEQGLENATGETPIAPRVVVDPFSVDFGEVPLAQTATETVTVTNEGNAGLELYGFGISGPVGFSFAWLDEGTRTRTRTRTGNDQSTLATRYWERLRRGDAGRRGCRGDDRFQL